jgi:hypothetical protein
MKNVFGISADKVTDARRKRNRLCFRCQEGLMAGGDRSFTIRSQAAAASATRFNQVV